MSEPQTSLRKTNTYLKSKREAERKETEAMVNDAIKAVWKLSDHLEKVDKPKMYKANQAIHILLNL